MSSIIRMLSITLIFLQYLIICLGLDGAHIVDDRTICSYKSKKNSLFLVSVFNLTSPSFMSDWSEDKAFLLRLIIPSDAGVNTFDRRLWLGIDYGSEDTDKLTWRASQLETLAERNPTPLPPSRFFFLSLSLLRFICLFRRPHSVSIWFHPTSTNILTSISDHKGLKETAQAR